MKHGLKITICWNKYRSEITTQLKINNLDYMIDTTFRNINRLIVNSFKAGGNDPTRDSFDKYYMPLVEIKDFNVLINNKPFSEQPIKANKKRLNILIWAINFIIKSITRTFIMLNTVTENENTSFANISIPFLCSYSQH